MKKLFLLVLLLVTSNLFAGDPVIWDSSLFGKFLPTQGFKLFDGKQLRSLSVDPTAGAGVNAPVGSLGLRNNTNVGEYWAKIGVADTSWTNVLLATTGWKLLGNAGTNPTTSFLGTTDAQDLVLRTNNTERLRLLSTGELRLPYLTTAGTVITDSSGNISSIVARPDYLYSKTFHADPVNGSDTTGTGAPLNPFKSITKSAAACTAIVPTTSNRCLIWAHTGSYTVANGETSPIVLPSEYVSLKGDGMDNTLVTPLITQTLPLNSGSETDVIGITLLGGYTLDQTLAISAARWRLINGKTGGTVTITGFPGSGFTIASGANVVISGSILNGLTFANSTMARIYSSDWGLLTASDPGATNITRIELYGASPRGGVLLNGNSQLNTYTALETAVRGTTASGFNPSWSMGAGDIHAGFNAATTLNLNFIQKDTIIVSPAANVTLIAENLVLADATAGNVTVTLRAATLTKGREVTVVKTDATANTVTVTDGTYSYALTAQNQNVKQNSNGTAWFATSSEAPSSITNTKLAQMAAHTFKGNNTGSTANPIDLTAAQLTAELNNFIGDTGTGGTKGLVPAPAAGDAAAGKFLKADGTWAVASGGGGASTGSVDMTLSGGVTLFNTIAGYHRINGSVSLAKLELAMYGTKSTGSVTATILKNGSAITTGTLSGAIGVTSAEITLGSPIALVAGDVISVDITSVTTTGEDFTVGLIFQ